MHTNIHLRQLFRQGDCIPNGAHQRRNVLGAQLSLNVSVIQLADESVGPGLTGVYSDVHVVLPMPLAPLLLTAIHPPQRYELPT